MSLPKATNCFIWFAAFELQYPEIDPASKVPRITPEQIAIEVDRTSGMTSTLVG
jgi:hypothetical protein